MCGINGVINSHLRNLNVKDSRNLVSKMNKSLSHRGPDNDGIWSDSDGVVVFGHRRLSIIDTSNNGNQPMRSQSKNFIITFNGEIYNFNELRKKVADYAFQSNSDTEVILALCDRIGVKNALSLLEGMFALSIYDRLDNKVYLVRDKQGEKPLYYYSCADRFAFSSELIGITNVFLKKEKLCGFSISLYLKYGYFPGFTTPFKNVKKVKPGEFIIYDLENNNISSTQTDVRANYKHDLSNKSYDDCVDELDSIINESVKNQLVSDVPIGSFLSGGVDSSIITAIAQKHSSKPLECFTLGFNEKEFDESKYSAKIASHIGCNHNSLVLSNEILLEKSIDVIDSFSEPFSNPSSIPYYLISEFAKNSVSVCLAGDGGDELFIGYNRYIYGEKIFHKFKSLHPILQKSIYSLCCNVGKFDLDKSISKFLSLFNRKSAVNYGEKIRKIDLVGKSENLMSFYDNLISIFNKYDNLLVEISDELYNAKEIDFSKNFIYSSSYWDIKNYLPEDCLAKSDRMSMANSLEVRVPFLSSEILNFSNSLPKSYFLKDGESKAILKDVLKKYLPNSLFDRPKMGFTVPINSWVKSELSSQIEHSLRKENTARFGIITDDALTGLLENLSPQNAYKIWTLFILHRWLEKFSTHIDFSKAS